MIKELRKNIFNDSNSVGHKAICSIMLIAFLSISVSIPKPEEYSTLSESNKTVFITALNQISSETNINERNIRIKNFENFGNSLDDFSLNLLKIDDYYNQSDIRNFFNSLSLLLTSSPNNHSFRGPPSII
jgi:hypothetical protein